MRPVGLLTGIGVERVVDVGSAHGAHKKRVILDYRARFGSLRGVPVAGPSMRPSIVNCIFQGSAEKFQKTSKKYESRCHGEIWLAPRRPGGGTEHAS